MRRALLCALAAAAVLAPAAEARPFGYVEAEHLSFAPGYFQSVPPCVATELRVDNSEDIQRVAGDPFVAGYAQTYPLATWADAGLRCKIVLSQLTVDDTYYYGCVVMLHEYGHLLGLGHSRDPRNLMYPVLGGILPHVPQCLNGQRARRKGCARKRSERSRERCLARWRLDGGG